MGTPANPKHAILHRWFEVFNTGDLEKMRAVANEICTPEYQLHDPNYAKSAQTLTGFFEGFAPFMNSIRNPKVEILDIIVEGEKTATRVVNEWTDIQTNETKKGVGIFIHRFENGKIAEEWQVMVVGTTIK